MSNSSQAWQKQLQQKKEGGGHGAEESGNSVHCSSCTSPTPPTSSFHDQSIAYSQQDV